MECDCLIDELARRFEEFLRFLERSGIKLHRDTSVCVHGRPRKRECFSATKMKCLSLNTAVVKSMANTPSITASKHPFYYRI
jgi:hypothetical protein